MRTILKISACCVLAVSVLAIARPAPAAVSNSVPEAKQSAGVSGDWLSNAQTRIEESEYHVTWQNRTRLPDLEAAWHAPNRAQGLRTYFTAQGIRVVSRTEQERSWEWRLSLSGYGRGKLVRPVKPATLDAEGNRIDYWRGDLVEWYVNTKRGLAQGFTLNVPPEESTSPAPAEFEDQESVAARPLVPGARGNNASEGEAGQPIYLLLRLEEGLAADPSSDGQAIDFATAEGAHTIRYADLEVRDANESELEARMELFNDAGVRGIRIVVRDDYAVYPLTVEARATSSFWNPHGGQPGARFGTSMATAGDVNGDGYSDVIVGAPDYDVGHDNQGRAFLFYGSPAGLASSEGWWAEVAQDNANFGFSVATAGDVNNDGYSDVIVGAPGYSNPQAAEGAAFVYHGSENGLSQDPYWSVEGNQADGAFGHSVATAGDVDKDTYSDVIVGAPDYNAGLPYQGQVRVYLGSADGLADTESWTAQGVESGAYFGYSVATAGDVDGDGHSDVIVGAPGYEDHHQTGNEGAAYVYHGSDSEAGLEGTAAWWAQGNRYLAEFGRSVSTAGDFNGDGYSDVIVGAPFEYGGGSGTGHGRFSIYYGGLPTLSPTADLTYVGIHEGANVGWSVATAGDRDGDGYSDVIVGAPQRDDGGAVSVYYGNASGYLSGNNWIEIHTGAEFGYSVATAGDVNGDGYSDMIAGMPGYNGSEGAGWAFHGHAGWPTWPPDPDLTGGQAQAKLGVSVASAGDVNGDGYSDLVAGAYTYDYGDSNEGAAFICHGGPTGPTPWVLFAHGDQGNAWLGLSVASAGDVNGDGYSDVIVGAHRYDDPQETEDVGRAYVFHGSEHGITFTPAWTVDGDQESAYLGYPVATAGDVNGDGYSDVIVGVYGLNDSRGAAYVFHGSAPGGLSQTADWIAEGTQLSEEFGSSVATAGDVNGDGYSDVIIGASKYESSALQTDEGRALIYHGSGAGLTDVPAWEPEGEQEGARFGFSVATAGDVNGDGYSDVIVGARDHDNTYENEGMAIVYHGSPQGPSQAWQLVGGQDHARLGNSVATAGDVNGDGYADVIVGAQNYDDVYENAGKVYIYAGSGAGLSYLTTRTGSQEGALLGYSVATAGDVDGDGYSDVIAGAPFYMSGHANEGAAFLGYGNFGPNPSVRPRQWRLMDGPIAHLGSTDGPVGFRILYGRPGSHSPFGPGQRKLEWEVEPLGSLFDGLGTETSFSWSDSPALDETVSGLTEDTPYHWRVRARYPAATSPFQQWGRWVRLPSGGWNETMLRTPSAPGAGRVPETSLRATKLITGEIAWSWGESCLNSDADAENDDTDYAIYEGVLGDFTSHTWRDCTTYGATSINIYPFPGDRYYLVVPRKEWYEGSHGNKSSGTPRPVGAATCRPQKFIGCP